MGIMTRAATPQQLEEGINTVFGLEYKRHPEIWKSVFETRKSNKAYEEDVSMTGLGYAPVKPEGQGISYDSGEEFYTKRYYHDTIALGFVITQEQMDDNLYGDVGNRMGRSLANAMQQTKEVRAHSILNNGFSSSFPGGDGKALLTTDHPVRGNTFANELTTPADLSETSLEEVLTLIEDFVDNRGLRIVVQPKKLLVPNALRYQAHRLLESDLRTGTGDNDVNAIKGMGLMPGGYVSSVYLTDPDAFFVLTDCPVGLTHMERSKLVNGREGEFDTGNFKYKASERYSFGWTDPRGIAGSEGGGA